MLNEIGEYEQYILSPEKLVACENRRLKYHTLIKVGFGGLERAMTIIARHFIFDTPVGFDEDELREILKAWCGFPHEAKTTLPAHFDGWLKNYIQDVLLEEAKQNQNGSQIKNVMQAHKKLHEKNQHYTKSVFEMSDNFYAITYDKVIANALLAGKLHCYCLACDQELFEAKKICRADGKKIKSKGKDIILKMTTKYLLQRRYTTQEFIVINITEMINWIVGSEKNERLKFENYLLTETGAKIFEIDKIGMGESDRTKVTKIKIHPEWAKHFRLIEYDGDKLDTNWGRIFFTDSGSSDFLKESVCPWNG